MQRLNPDTAVAIAKRFGLDAKAYRQQLRNEIPWYRKPQDWTFATGSQKWLDMIVVAEAMVRRQSGAIPTRSVAKAKSGRASTERTSEISASVPNAHAPKRKLEHKVVGLVQAVLNAERGDSKPDWLQRPGKQECGSEWDRISRIYAELTDLTLPKTMPPREWREIDAVLLVRGSAPRILEFDERQHFNAYRATTLSQYSGLEVAFGIDAWLSASKPKRGSGVYGSGKPRPPLFPGEHGRHRQRAFRDALCDILAPLNGYAPTLQIAHFEVEAWIDAPDARQRMADLLRARICER